MDFDDVDGPQKKSEFQIGADLSSYSVEELQLLANQLTGEISRINEAIERKKGDLESANSLFKN